MFSFRKISIHIDTIWVHLDLAQEEEEAVEAEVVGEEEASLPEELEVVEGAVEEDFHLEAVVEEVVDVVEVAVVAEDVEAGVVVWEEERKLSLSHTDMRVSSLPEVRRMLWSQRTWCWVRVSMVRRGLQLKMMQAKLSTEFGIHSDQSWLLPFWEVLTKFTCHQAARYCSHVIVIAII